MSHLCTVFFPFEKIKDDGEDNIEVVTSANGNEFSVYARVYDKSLIKTYKLKVGDDAQTQMSVLLFNVLCEITGFKPPWGILFGVRPAKLMHRYVEELGEERARNHFINTFLASPQKTDLALEVMNRENKIIYLAVHIALLFLILLKKRISFLNLMLIFFAVNLKKQGILQSNSVCVLKQYISAAARRLPFRLRSLKSFLM